MGCFHELSRLTQEHWPDRKDQSDRTLGAGKGDREGVEVIEIKTVGAYEVAVLSCANAASLTEWLDANHFVFPKGKQGLLDTYVQKQWYFVAARINPEGSGFALRSGPQKRAAIAPSTLSKLAKGERHPLVLSFPSAKCVFPLAISAVNGKPSEVSLYVLAAEPLMSRVIFERDFEASRRERARWLQGRPKRVEERRRFYEQMQAAGAIVVGSLQDASLDPDEEEYYEGRELLKSMEVEATELPASVRELPRLGGKSWWLTKQVQTFSPEEMRDLEFELAVPFLARKPHEPDGLGPAHSLAQFGARAIPVILAGLTNSDPAQRSLALSALREAESARCHI
jgi:hypothetical protein